MPAHIFPNSLPHRRRVRLWMSLLVGFPMLTADEFRLRLGRLWTAIEHEAVPSTRLFIEWLIVLGLLKHGREADLEGLLNRLLEFSVPTGMAVSTLTITMLVGCKLEEQLFGQLCQRALDRILPWLIHNNHMVRLFALYVFDRLVGRLDALPPAQRTRITIPAGYANLKVFLDQSEHNQRFLAKLARDWFLCDFDPIRDYSVQTIFGRLPAEAGIARNECISMVRCRPLNAS